MEIYLCLSLFLAGAGGYLCMSRPAPWKRPLFWGLAFLALTLVSGLREGIGYDYDTYAQYYELLSREGVGAFFRENPRMEPGLFFLMVPFSWFTSDPRWMFLGLAAVSSGLLLEFVRRNVPERYEWVAVYAYVTLTFFYGSMNLMRQSMAALIALYAIPFVLKRRPLPFFAVVLLAAFFHRTALILLPFYWILNLPFRRWTPAAYLAGGTILYFAVTPILRRVTGWVYSYYSVSLSIYMKPGGAVYLILPSLLAAVFLLCAAPFLEKKENNKIFLHFVLWTLLFYVLMTRHYIMERLALYFFLPLIWGIPELLSALTPPKAAPIRQRKFFLFMAGVFLAVCLGYQVFAGVRGFHGVIPYKSIFSGGIRVEAVLSEGFEKTFYRDT